MISYKEEYLKDFKSDELLSSPNFKVLLDSMKDFSFYVPYVKENEDNFLKEVKQVLDIITGIIRKPHIATKDEDIIVRSELASSFDTESFKETLRDSSLWKNKRGVMSPEEVHVTSSTDTYVIYENIFIVKLVDLLIDELKGFLSLTLKKEETLDSYYDLKEVNYSRSSFLNDIDEDEYQTFLVSKEDNLQAKEHLVKKYLKRIHFIRETAFYKEVSKAPTRRSELVLTNILMKDRRYNTCFKFYSTYFLYGEKSENVSYTTYVVLRLIKLLNEKYQISEKSLDTKLSLKDSYLTLDKPVVFVSKNFNYEVSSKEDEIYLEVSLKSDSNKRSKHLIITREVLNPKDFLELKREIELKKQEFYSVSLVSLEETKKFERTMVLSFLKTDDKEHELENFLKSLTILFEAKDSTYENHCMVCGSSKVEESENSNELTCSKCGSIYEHVDIDGRDLIWLKKIGDVNDGR